MASNDPARHVHVVDTMFLWLTPDIDWVCLVSNKLIKYCNHEQRRKDALLIKVKIIVVKLFRFAHLISYFLLSTVNVTCNIRMVLMCLGAEWWMARLR